MPKILFKVLTVVLLISNLSNAFESSNPVFSQMKGDMWSMGLDFDYVHGDKIVSPRLNGAQKKKEAQSRALQIEEISKALNI